MDIIFLKSDLGTKSEWVRPKQHKKTRAFRAWRIAFVCSLAIHALAVLAFWYGCDSASWAKTNGGRVVDTLVSGSSIDWDVCLQLDEPVAKPKKAVLKPIQPSSNVGKIPIEKTAFLTHPPEIMTAALTASSHPTATMPSPFIVAATPASTIAGSALGSPSGQEGGAPAGTTSDFFQVPIRARSVVYVIDRSASMGLRGALDRAKRELLTSLEKLPAETRFQIIIYNRRAECLPIGGWTDLVSASVENKGEAAALLQSVRPEGSTDPLPALRQALALRPEVIFFLSDADDFNVKQVIALTQLNHGRSIINAIELNTPHRDRDDLPLQVLAQSNRGQYRAVSVDAP